MKSSGGGLAINRTLWKLGCVKDEQAEPSTDSVNVE